MLRRVVTALLVAALLVATAAAAGAQDAAPASTTPAEGTATAPAAEEVPASAREEAPAGPGTLILAAVVVVALIPLVALLGARLLRRPGDEAPSAAADGEAAHDAPSG